MGRLFFGGIHPAGRKETTRRKPLMTFETAPAQVFIPLKMSSGAPAIPVVQAGDAVKPGQLIAQADGDYSTNVYSSVSGTVECIQDTPFPWGGTAPMIVIANDSKHHSSTCILPPLNWERLSQEAILERIQLAGITDMDREAAPAHWKIRHARGRADTLIVLTLPQTTVCCWSGGIRFCLARRHCQRYLVSNGASLRYRATSSTQWNCLRNVWAAKAAV